MVVSCEKKDDSVIDPTLSFPAIDSVYMSPTTFDTSAINAVVTALVRSDLPISSVTASIKDPDNLERQNVILKDDGVAPDPVAGDNQYTGTVSFVETCRLIGTYNAEFVAVNSSGLFSPLVTTTFQVTNTNNHPPFITNLIIPDSLQRPLLGTNVAFLQVMATDPEGQCDINQVFFHSFRPDGIPTHNGLPFFMFDDGNPLNCDTIAGDSKYSLCIGIDSSAQLGYFKFVFNATDRHNPADTSNTLIDSIYVHQ